MGTNEIFSLSQRQTNIELLRGLAMLMVIIMHALGHGGILQNIRFGSISYILLWLLSTLCQVAVPCFVLISGYFLVSKKFKLSRLVKLELQVLFYSLLGILLNCIFLLRQLA